VIELWRELGADAEPWWATLTRLAPPREAPLRLVYDANEPPRRSERIETPRDLPVARRAGGR